MSLKNKDLIHEALLISSNGTGIANCLAGIPFGVHLVAVGAEFADVAGDG